MKRIICILLSSLLLTTVFCFSPLTAFAESEEERPLTGKTGDCTWTLDDNGTLTISGNGATGDYETYYEYYPKPADDGRLYYKTSAPWRSYDISEVVIEEGVTAIGTAAFQGCAHISSATLPDSLKTIKSNAFRGCKSLKSIVIPDGVTSVGYTAFCNCRVLKSVSIPNSVESIEDYAFGYEFLDYTDAVDFEKVNDFMICGGCYTAAESYAFNNLIDFRYNDDSPVPSSPTGAEIKKCGRNGDCFWIIDAEDTLVISGNGEMENNMLPPWFVDKCGISIKKAVIGHGVTNIGDYAFMCCLDLESVTIPDTVTKVGDSVFAFCEKLSSVTVDENNPVFDSRDNCNAIIETKTNTLVVGINSSVIPGSVETIGQTAFIDCEDLKSITIPEGVKEIKNSAFFDCINLKNVTLPDSLTRIERSAFYGCESLKRIKIPDSVTYISEHVFSENTTIYGTKDSYAIEYAKDNKLNWKICSKCPACGKLLYGTEKLTVPGYEATNTEDGLTNGVKCAFCGEWLVEPQVIPKLKSEIPAGDINNDGVIDIFDAALIQKYAVDKITLTDEQKEVADVNDDGVVDIFDATDIQKFAVEKITEFKKKA